MTTTHPLRPELEPLPERMKLLPVDERGYCVPWFVAWVNGPNDTLVPEFRAMDPAKLIMALRMRLCWVCGQRLGAWKCFVVGPMCGINRTSSEPPSHLECAQWSARNCPFLARPHMVRREDDEMNNERLKEAAAGIALTRNPGVTLLWITRDFEAYRDPIKNKGVLFEMGEPERVEWYAESRPATRDEVSHSVTTGLPAIMELARLEEGGVAEVERRLGALVKLYPKK